MGLRYPEKTVLRLLEKMTTSVWGAIILERERERYRLKFSIYIAVICLRNDAISVLFPYPSPYSSLVWLLRLWRANFRIIIFLKKGIQKPNYILVFKHVVSCFFVLLFLNQLELEKFLHFVCDGFAFGLYCGGWFQSVCYHRREIRERIVRVQCTVL